MQDFGQDIRFAFRMLAKSPLVTGAAILSLALGIGASTAIFSLINAVFLRGLPVEEPGRLVSIYTSEKGQMQGQFMPLSRPNFVDLRAATTEVFSDLAEQYYVTTQLRVGGGEPDIVSGRVVSSNYFTVLGLQPFLGRFLTPENNKFGPGPPEVVLSYRCWSRRFAADPEILGQTVHLTAEPFTVVGVAPRGFVGTMVLSDPAFWTAVSPRSSLLPGSTFEERHALTTDVIARLHPGVSHERALQTIRGLARSLRTAYPKANENRDFGAIALAELRVPFFLRTRYMRSGALLLAAAGLVLLVACVNVAHLMLGRAWARQRETATRLALGAPRGRLLRQWFTESLVLACLAGLVGLIAASWLRTALWSLRSQRMQNIGLELGTDFRVLLFSLLVTLATGLLFGLAPALRGSRAELIRDLALAGDAPSPGVPLLSFRNLLQIGQVALCLVGVVAMGLCLKSLGLARHIDPGFKPKGLLVTRLGLRFASGVENPATFLRQLRGEVRNLPGVEKAHLSNFVPLSLSSGPWLTVAAAGDSPDFEQGGVRAPVATVDAGFLESMGLDVFRGRGLVESDQRGRLVAVVNESLATRLWPGEAALGQRLRIHGITDPHEVIGVVRDTDYLEIGGVKNPMTFLPRGPDDVLATTLVVRCRARPAEMMEPIRRLIHELGPGVPIRQMITGADILEESLWSARLAAALMSFLGTVALLLATIGIYAGVAYSARQRYREISIRMAMGAHRMDVLRLIVQQGMTVVGLGWVLGVIVAMATGRFVVGLLYGVEPTDMVVLGATSGVLVATALIANLVPAWRAATLDPARNLQS